MIAMGIALPLVAVAIVFGVSARGSAQRRAPLASGGPPAPTAGAPHDWAAFLDTVASAVRAGHSLPRAVDHAREHAHSEQANSAGRSAGGRAAADADRAVAQQALQVAAELGGPVAAGLQHAADLLRERRVMRAEARAHAAQARLSAVVLTLLPVAFAAFGLCTSESYRHALSSGAGVGMAGAGLAVNLIGWRWMQRIIAAATR